MVNDMSKLKKLKLFEVAIIITVVIVIGYISLGMYNYTIVSKYDNKIYPNVFVDNYEISGIDKDKVVTRINEIRNEIEQHEISFKANNIIYKYKLGDLGISINSDELANEILTYTNNLSYLEKLQKISLGEKTIFNHKLVISKEKTKDFFEKIKEQVDSTVVEGKLVVDNKRNVYFDKGKPSFSLDVEKNVSNIYEKLDSILTHESIELIGDAIQPKYNKLSTINKKVSSFTTSFDTKVSRAKNLENGAKLLDGTIVQPGEVFSFYKAVGPYRLANGYVYYHGVVGSGVCQVSTTVYNAFLLAGLKTVKRSAHAYKMWYVDGGLDATVADNKNGATVDLKFQNTYKYPIYISAYTKDGKITVEFWSNENATDGKIYKTESKQIGYRGYNTYLITYKDGKQISKNLIDTTWYPKGDMLP